MAANWPTCFGINFMVMWRPVFVVLLFCAAHACVCVERFPSALCVCVWRACTWDEVYECVAQVSDYEGERASDCGDDWCCMYTVYRMVRYISFLHVSFRSYKFELKFSFIRRAARFMCAYFWRSHRFFFLSIVNKHFAGAHGVYVVYFTKILFINIISLYVPHMCPFFLCIYGSYILQLCWSINVRAPLICIS